MSYSFIEKHFKRHYASHDYEVLPPGSLLDPSTPMTFVGSAGLAQVEHGIEHREEHSGERYVLVQNCFRHFDIEKVGKDPVHLSLFGMGGAFAFGRVSRRDTLGKIWTFLTDELGFDKQRLWATYFTGGELEGHDLTPDRETYTTWQALGLDTEHIVGVGLEEGYWKQGDGLEGNDRYRKCGPTTELFYDRGAYLCCGPRCRPGCQCGRFIEMSNILFIHDFMDEETNVLSPMVTPFDETVIGIERVAVALNESTGVFELPCFAPVLRFIRDHYKREDVLGDANPRESERVIADHARALLFLTADGAPAPGKGGRARIMRLLIRGFVTQMRILGVEDRFFFGSLIDRLVDIYRDQYPHLERWREATVGYFRQEKVKFQRTLSRGYKQLDRVLSRDDVSSVSGGQAIHLVKRKGFPYPLLKATLEERSVAFDPQEYHRAHDRWYQKILAQNQG
jgi:alanyl-tRNA synthetase